MRKICLISAHRSEYGLLSPVMKELQKRGDVEAIWFRFDCEKTPHQILKRWIVFLAENKPDIIAIPTDRVEVTYLASYAFNNGFIVTHAIHAGDIGSGVYDEMNRRAISCFSHIMFCNSPESQRNLWRAGEESWRAFAVGSTAFDGITEDESLVPDEPYDLVLLHPDPINKEATIDDLKMTLSVLDENHLTIWLRPNKDKNHEVIDEYLNLIESEGFPVHGHLPRSQFLGLLKNCRRFIGNSSSLCYESPHYMVETVRIGRRNADRPAVMPVTGGSKRIAEILATIPIDDKLRRKKLVL